MKSGQTLVVLLVFISVALIITSAAASLSLISTSSSSRLAESQIVYDLAESGVENALIRFLRDPDYSGETLTVGSGYTTITVTGINPVTITSRGVVGNFRKSIQVTGQFVNGRLTITSWQEIYN